MIRNITIFGFARANPGEKLYQDAFEVARVLAEAGYNIVNGGGPGVMRAASEGAKKGGGRVTAIYFSPTGMTRFEGRDLKNPADEKILVPNYVERTLKLLEYGDCYLIFAGGAGTISEFGMAWGLAKLYFGYHKPLLLYGSFWHEIMEALGRNLPLRDEELHVYRIVSTPQDALFAVRELSLK